MSEQNDHSELEKTSRAGAPAPTPPAPEMADDAGSQALSDALQSSFAIVKVIMIALVVVFLGSGFFQVGSQEKALILRFGKPVGEDEKALLGAGAHWALPYPIDEVVKIPIGQVQTVHSTVGWYATTAAQEAANNEPPPAPSLNPATEGYMLTADGNIIHVRGTLLYRISEPGLRYMFDFAEASNQVQNAFNNALVFAAASFTVDNALTRDIAGFRDKVRARIEQLMAEQKLGISVDQINVQTLAPRILKENFEAVLAAELDRSKLISEARSYQNQTINRAEAEAKARINTGETERKRLVEFVAAEATRFTDLLPAYQRNPQLFIEQRQSEVLQRILANAQDKFIVPDRLGGNSHELRIQLGREPQKVKPIEPQAAPEKH